MIKRALTFLSSLTELKTEFTLFSGIYLKKLSIIFFFPLPFEIKISQLLRFHNPGVSFSTWSHPLGRSHHQERQHQGPFSPSLREGRSLISIRTNQQTRVAVPQGTCFSLITAGLTLLLPFVSNELSSVLFSCNSLMPITIVLTKVILTHLTHLVLFFLDKGRYKD